MTTLSVVRALAAPSVRADVPRIADAYDRAFERFGIRDRRARALILAQIAHESSGFSNTSENMNYSAARIRQVWPSRPGAVKFARNPRGLANFVYGGRMGNRLPDDGWNFRGGGHLQHTGRDEYERVTRRTGFDVVNHPEMLRTSATLDVLAQAAVSFIADRPRALAAANAGAVEALSRAINGGTVGLADRQKLSRRALAAMDSAPAPAREPTAQERATEARQKARHATAGTVAAPAAVAPVAAVPGTDWGAVVVVVVLALAIGGFFAWRLSRRASEAEQEVIADRVATVEARAKEAGE